MTTVKVEFVRARIEPELKQSAESVLAQLGMSLSDAIRIFLSQVSLRQEFPVELKIPNRTTLAAMAAPVTDDIYDSVEDLFGEILNADEVENQKAI